MVGPSAVSLTSGIVPGSPSTSEVRMAAEMSELDVTTEMNESRSLRLAAPDRDDMDMMVARESRWWRWISELAASNRSPLSMTDPKFVIWNRAVGGLSPKSWGEVQYSSMLAEDKIT